MRDAVPTTTQAGRAWRCTLALALGLVSFGALGFERAPTSASTFDFDDGLQGWVVEDLPGSPTTWTPQDDPRAKASGGVVGLSAYLSNAGTTITSPVIEVAEPSVLTFEVSWWLEAFHADVVDLQARTDGGSWETLHSFHSGGRSPLWDDARFVLPDTGAVEVRFSFLSDIACDEVGTPTYAEWQVGLGGYCGEGFWFDDVAVVALDQLGDDLPPAWGDGPGASPIVDPSPVGEDVAMLVALGITSQAQHHRPTGDDEWRDQLANPEFLSSYDDPVERRLSDDWYRDPYLADWEGTVGTVVDVQFLNRYRTPIRGRAYLPTAPGPHPLLVFVGGWGSTVSHRYSPMIQRLVEEGYVVLNVSSQGQRSGRHGSAVLPAPEFCRDAPDTWWRQPQEGGLVETQPCAGFEAPAEELPGTADQYATAYRQMFGATFTFVVLDAVDWALGDANPWGDRVDRDAGVGTFGHSAGAYGAMAAAQVDDRIRASVMLDMNGSLLGLPATTPTLAITSDNFDAYAEMPGNSAGVAEELVANGVDAGFLLLENTGHYGSAWRPPHAVTAAVDAAVYRTPLQSPWAKPVGHHYLLGWFDRFLGGDESAAGRLHLTTFDGSADATAGGQGRWDASVGNMPYTIEGRPVADFLDQRMTSWIQVDGTRRSLAGSDS